MQACDHTAEIRRLELRLLKAEGRLNEKTREEYAREPREDDGNKVRQPLMAFGESDASP
jgi:hypothetical protein